MTTIGYLERSRLDAALAALAERCDVYAPQLGSDEDAPRLLALPTAGPVALEARKPLLPLKTLFLPGAETLLRYLPRSDEPAVEPHPATERERVVFGALGCDIAALELLDRVLLEEPADDRYRARRERTTIVALACGGEGPECFCASTGIDPLRPAGADALLVPDADGCWIESLTERGARLAEPLSAYLDHKERPDGTPATSAARTDDPLAALPGGWSGVWDSPLWEELALRCLGCGICTVLCPTCHCFDIEDRRSGATGERLRVWDTCMAVQFTLMAGGDNPRRSLHARLRQRFLHKLAYLRDKCGAPACVGCGRCTRACPAGIGIEEVAARLSGTGGADD